MTRKGRCGRDRFWNCCKRHKNSQQKPILDRMQGSCPVLQTFPRKILTFPLHPDLAKVLDLISFLSESSLEDDWSLTVKVKSFCFNSFSRIENKQMLFFREIGVKNTLLSPVSRNEKRKEILSFFENWNWNENGTRMRPGIFKWFFRILEERDFCWGLSINLITIELGLIPLKIINCIFSVCKQGLGQVSGENDTGDVLHHYQQPQIFIT